MSALYLDCSAFVKLAVEEPETAALRGFLASRGHRRVSSALLRTEALRAVRHLGAEALATVREGLRRVDLVGIDDRILDAAACSSHGCCARPMPSTSRPRWPSVTISRRWSPTTSG